MLHGLGQSEGASSYATAEDHRSGYDAKDDAIPVPWSSSPVPADTSSATHSEAPSFREREAELETIQARFGDVLSQRKLPSTFQSRFKEEFSDPDPPERQRLSLLSKIHLKSTKNAGKASKYSHLFRNWSVLSLDCMQEENPVGALEPKRYSSATIRPDTSLGQSAYETHVPWWEKVIKQDQKTKILPQAYIETSKYPDVASGEDSGFGSLAVKNETEPNVSLPGPTEATEIEPCTEATQPKRRTTPRIDESPISDYYSVLATKRSFPPQSWAKYPSHLYGERNGRAEHEDNVTTHDFAAHPTSSTEGVRGMSDKPLETKARVEINSTPVIHEKLGRAFRSGMSKLVPLVDLRRHKLATGVPTHTKPPTPSSVNAEDREAEGDSLSAILDGTNDRLPYALVLQQPSILSEFVSGQLDDAGSKVGVSSTSSRRLVQPYEETVSFHPVSVRSHGGASNIPPEARLRLPALRLAVSDYSLQRPRSQIDPTGTQNWQRSFTCLGPQHLRGDQIMDIGKWHEDQRHTSQA